MANQIKIKRSAVEGKVPLVTDLELGELAINTYDGKLFVRRNDGVSDYIREIGGNRGFEVKNKTGSTIAKGTAVGFVGTLGSSGKLLVAPFIANGTQPSQYFIGLAEDDILNGGDGYVVDHGKLLNLDTSDWPSGTILYASSTQAGGLTSTQPAAPNNKITVAAVVNSSSTVGVLEVRVQIGSSLDNDELVEVSNPQNGDTLVYNSIAGRFENGPAAETYTLPVATTTVLGGVKDGAGVTIAADGTISADVTSVAGRTGAVVLTKSDVGLGNVDNTADANKVVASAAKLTTARTIGGVSFDGTTNINLPGVNTTGNQNTTGNAATATTASYANGLRHSSGTWQYEIGGSSPSNGQAIVFNSAANRFEPGTIESGLSTSFEDLESGDGLVYSNTVPYSVNTDFSNSSYVYGGYLQIFFLTDKIKQSVQSLVSGSSLAFKANGTNYTVTVSSVSIFTNDATIYFNPNTVYASLESIYLPGSTWTNRPVLAVESGNIVNVSSVLDGQAIVSNIVTVNRPGTYTWGSGGGGGAQGYLSYSSTDPNPSNSLFYGLDIGSTIYIVYQGTEFVSTVYSAPVYNSGSQTWILSITTGGPNSTATDIITRETTWSNKSVLTDVVTTSLSTGDSLIYGAYDSIYVRDIEFSSSSFAYSSYINLYTANPELRAYVLSLNNNDTIKFKAGTTVYTATINGTVSDYGTYLYIPYTSSQFISDFLQEFYIPKTGWTNKPVLAVETGNTVLVSDVTNAQGVVSEIVQTDREYSYYFGVDRRITYQNISPKDPYFSDIEVGQKVFLTFPTSVVYEYTVLTAPAQDANGYWYITVDQSGNNDYITNLATRKTIWKNKNVFLGKFEPGTISNGDVVVASVTVGTQYNSYAYFSGPGFTDLYVGSGPWLSELFAGDVIEFNNDSSPYYRTLTSNFAYDSQSGYYKATVAETSQTPPTVNNYRKYTQIWTNGQSSGGVSSVAGRTGDVVLTKSDVGLADVDNTADAVKAVASAAKLTTARTIGGVSFDGTASINLPGVNITGNQNTTGSAAKLTTSRTISITGDLSWSTSFDGSGNATGSATLATVMSSPGTYTKLTVNGKGLVTSATSLIDTDIPNLPATKIITGTFDAARIPQLASTKIDTGIIAVAALNIDCSLGTYFTKTINANSTFTFGNAPSGKAYSFVLELTHTSGTVTWPASVRWPADTAPTLTAGKTHLFVFVTDDGGTTWRGASSVDYTN